MSKGQILIVEDEANIAEVLTAYCRQGGYSCHHLTSGSDVVPYVRTHPVDLILLDLMLPDEDGISLCKQIRQFSQVPIIMVTARSEEIDRLLGLELGADDYICKPFSPREVVARINVVLRRLARSEQSELAVAGLQIWPDQYKLLCHGQPLELTPSEFRLLAVLADQPNRVHSREQLIAAAYDDQTEVTDRNIDTHIKNIRRKIRQLWPEFQAIESVYGVGYRLVEK